MAYCLRQDKGFASDQGKVWEGVRHKLQSLGASSPTEAMSEVFEHEETRLDEYRKAFRLIY